MWQLHCRKCKKKKKKKNCFGNCGNSIAENVKKKKKCFGNCGNGIAENGEKKCCEICERVKEKLSRPQYFHNKSHVINYY